MTTQILSMEKTTEKHNEQIIKLWKTHQSTQGLIKLSPSLYPTFKETSVLYVGLNPSFNLKGIKNFLTKKNNKFLSIDDIEEIFIFTNINAKKDTIIGIEKIALENYSYFKKFSELSEAIDSSWNHIDLYSFRLTNQKELISLKEIHKIFFEAQLKINLKLINSIDPKYIVVVNAYASSIVKDELGLEWCNDIGTYLYKEKIPVFLSGMITGQRALDNESYKRLLWHLKNVNKIMLKK